jgi:hypothetical protein
MQYHGIANLILNTVPSLKIPQVGPKKLHGLLQFAVLDWSNGKPEDRAALRAGFIAHNENVRKLVPKEKLLEFTPKDGWEPLRNFLGKDVPNEPFPFINKGSNAANMVAAGLVIGYLNLIWKPAVIAFLAWLAYRWVG